MGWKRRRIYALVGSAAIAAALLAVVPALGQTIAGDDAVAFTVLDGPPRFEYGDEPDQVLTTPRNGCQITSNEPLIDLTANGNRNPGLNADSIGVKSTGSNANGTPCSQIDGSEILKIEAGSSLEGRTFSKVRLDLEMTGNAVVKLTLGGPAGETFHLQTGTSITVCGTDAGAPGCNGDTNATTPPYEVSSGPGENVAACAAPNSSGPNSGASDNCVWTVDPGFDFASVELSVVGIGTVSLEGGGDSNFPSLFHLGLEPLACGETLALSEDGVTAEYTRLENDPCPPKTYTLDLVVTDVDNLTVRFQPRAAAPVPDCSADPDACTEEFMGELSFVPQAEANAPDTGALEYDPAFRADPDDAVFRLMEWCEFDPFAESLGDGLTRRDALPQGESFCIVSVVTEIESTTETRTTWKVYGIGDPLNRLS